MSTKYILCTTSVAGEPTLYVNFNLQNSRPMFGTLTDATRFDTLAGAQGHRDAINRRAHRPGEKYYKPVLVCTVEEIITPVPDPKHIYFVVLPFGAAPSCAHAGAKSLAKLGWAPHVIESTCNSELVLAICSSNRVHHDD